MSGCMQDQVRLIAAFEAYMSAERASEIVGDSVRDQWRKADRLHGELLQLAIACGYEPHGLHRHLLTAEWVMRRIEALLSGCPNHVAEAKRGTA